mmetsp:Transcript_679/g.725  ORF Transcript_679/g.725 Transcript_679/m.725 type:complete len:111 (+) Transcript_679:113-445(+)
MRHVAAYALLLLGGNETPSAKDVKKVLDKAGVEANDEELDKFLASVEGKNAFDLIKDGREQLKNVATAAVAVSAGAAATGGAAPTEEKKKEESEEAEADMGGLFGDDDDY